MLLSKAKLKTLGQYIHEYNISELTYTFTDQKTGNSETIVLKCNRLAPKNSLTRDDQEQKLRKKIF